MSLLDVDKNSHDRSAPSVSNAGTLDGRAAHGTSSVNDVTDATLLAQIADGKNGRFTIARYGQIVFPGGGTDTPTAGQYLSATYVFGADTHNLGFIPAFIGFIVGSDGSSIPVPYENSIIGTSAQSARFSYNVRLTATDITLIGTFMLYGASFSLAGFTMKYFLLRQTVS